MVNTATTAVANLSAEQSWELLGQSTLGRLAVAVGEHPDIFPVNYHAGDGRILFRSAEGTKLAELVVNENVAFEVDSYGPTSGWSVVVKGTARILAGGNEIAVADEVGLTPWVPTLKYNYVAISVVAISGRRFEFGPEPERYPV